MSNDPVPSDTDYNHADDGTHEFPHDHEWDWSKTPARQKAKGKKIMEGVFVGGTSYLLYRAIRMMPSLLCPPTIIPNAIMPWEREKILWKIYMITLY